MALRLIDNETISQQFAIVRKQVEEDPEKISKGLKTEDALNQATEQDGARIIANNSVKGTILNNYYYHYTASSVLISIGFAV